MTKSNNELYQHQEFVKTLTKYIKSNTLSNSNKLIQDKYNLSNSHSLVLANYLNETYFSNILAWLLNPKEDHGFGVRFGQELIRYIHQFSNNDVKINKLSISNSTALREFYLSSDLRANKHESGYVDVVFFDLDYKDNFFYAIENKLFTENHGTQLTDYYGNVNEKFERVKTKKYIYLTLAGRDTKKHSKDDPEAEILNHEKWLKMAWVSEAMNPESDTEYNSIFNILEKLYAEKKNEGVKLIHPDVIKLIEILNWLGALQINFDGELLKSLKMNIISSVKDCIKEELDHLCEGKTGDWDIKRGNDFSYTLSHSTFPSNKLKLRLLGNMTVTIQAIKSSKPLFEKIVLPLGTNAEQVFHLINIAAKDICNHVFGDSKSKYMRTKAKQHRAETEMEKLYKPFFNLIAKNELMIKSSYMVNKVKKETKAE